MSFSLASSSVSLPTSLSLAIFLALVPLLLRLLLLLHRLTQSFVTSRLDIVGSNLFYFIIVSPMELQRSLGWLFVTPKPQHDKRAINQN
jgi:hypothetical protein